MTGWDPCVLFPMVPHNPPSSALFFLYPRVVQDEGSRTGKPHKTTYFSYPEPSNSPQNALNTTNKNYSFNVE